MTIEFQEIFEKLALVSENDDFETLKYKFILSSFIFGYVNDYVTDWKRLLHNAYENKYHTHLNQERKTDISDTYTLWQKFDLAKSGEDIEGFFKFLKKEAIRYNLQKCSNMHGIRLNINETFKEILELSVSNNNITKALSDWVEFADIQFDDVILSGIFDTRTIPHAIKTNLKLRGIWDLFDEKIPILELPIEFEEFIEGLVINDDDRIPAKYYSNENANYNKLMREEYRAFMILIRKIMKLWDNPTYKSEDIMKSTWNHDAVGPIIEYILDNIYLYQNWETKTVESSLVLRGISKKSDFQGYKSSLIKKSYKYEFIFGETSYDLNHSNSKIHIYNDQVRLAKFGKIAFESLFNFIPERFHKRLAEEVNIFLIQSHKYFVTLSLMDYKFFPFGRIRSLESIYVPVERSPNSLTYIKKMCRLLYNYRIFVKKTDQVIDNLDKELASLGAYTPSIQIRTAVRVFKTP
ncbi:5552_t:CDS:2 [Ambispora gerdemannii]|uniref:5552_t:CDS:1 n=1 Tax=Ambispora gerdemannii TaxID=144530 RepID=A0A9N8V6G7_9GLOM|nr:5552_t:CDS:2 [Ambispora gerdemannii]